jgi:hypothetical protein
MTATLLANTIWEGVASEMTGDLPDLADGQFFKQQDTGET